MVHKFFIAAIAFHFAILIGSETSSSAAVFTFFPNSNPKPNCKSVYLYLANLRELDVDAERLLDEGHEYFLQARQVSDRVQNLVYEIYLEDGLFNRKQIEVITGEDAAQIAGSVVNVLRTNDVTGKAIGTLRMVRSNADLGFGIGLLYTSQENLGPSVLPMYAGFPEVRSYLDGLGPAVELGRLATAHGADRLANALILVDRALSLLPCCS